jgi:hypothetical protein
MPNKRPGQTPTPSPPSLFGNEDNGNNRFPGPYGNGGGDYGGNPGGGGFGGGGRNPGGGGFGGGGGGFGGGGGGWHPSGGGPGPTGGPGGYGGGWFPGGGGWHPSGGGSGPPGGPPPTPGTGPYDPSAKKSTFVCKPDLKAYTELKAAESYGKWIEDTVCVLRAQGLGMFLDPHYVPDIQDAVEWDAKKSFVYMMLLKNVKTLTGMCIVKNHRPTYDAQAVLAELADEHMRSTSAVISGRKLLTRITTRRFDPRGKLTAMEFISKFENMTDQYNEQQMSPSKQLHDELKRTLLMSALLSVLVLRSVGDREQESFVCGGPAYDYHQYLAVVKTQAILYDDKSLGSRTANMANLKREIWTNEKKSKYREELSDIKETLVHLTKRQTPRTSMNKETWASLSAEGKTTWDKLNKSDKRKVLQYVTKRNEKDSMEANQHEVIETNENDVVQTEDKDEDNEAESGEINNAVTKHKEAHPGDLRLKIEAKIRAEL